MPGESPLHVKLVLAAAAEIKRQHRGTYSLTLLVDLPAYGENRPGRVGGYVPDIFAVDAPETCRIIGEAKTPNDLETERSYKQIQAFLRHLSLFNNGIFYLAVPWRYQMRAKSVLASTVRLMNLSAITTYIVTEE